MSKQASTSVRLALATVWSELLDKLDQLQPAIAGDRDIEALHDFRVALRKTRALQKLFKPYLPAKATAFHDNFLWLAAASSPVRDLDVLLNFATTQLPAMLGVDLLSLEPALKLLRRERQGSHAVLQKCLDSERSHQLMRTWRNYIEHQLLDADGARILDIPMAELARVVMIEQCLRILKKGRRIDQHTPPSEFHRMRIRIKRLRYLIDTLQPFLDGRRCTALLKPLSRLQLILGDHHDAVVAREHVRRVRAAMPENTAVIPLLQHWLEIIDIQQLCAEDSFGKALRKFADACPQSV